MNLSSLGLLPPVSKVKNTKNIPILDKHFMISISFPKKFVLKAFCQWHMKHFLISTGNSNSRVCSPLGDSEDSGMENFQR